MKHGILSLICVAALLSVAFTACNGKKEAPQTADDASESAAPDSTECVVKRRQCTVCNL